MDAKRNIVEGITDFIDFLVINAPHITQGNGVTNFSGKEVSFTTKMYQKKDRTISLEKRSTNLP